MVFKRKHIGIIYSPTENWIAGAYYVQNIVSALTHYDSALLPIIHVICKDRTTFHIFANNTHYPFLRFHKSSFSTISLFLRKTARNIIHIQFSTYKRFDYGLHKVSFIYPINELDFLKSKEKALAWIPDLQEKHLPHFFSESEIQTRNSLYEEYIKNDIPIVFSSNNAKQDFLYHYPAAKPNNTFVVPFAVFHPNFSHIDIKNLYNKYKISSPYLFCPNQFWAHKNHLLLFKAYTAARNKGLNLQLVCSGKMLDTRDPDYCNTISFFIEQNHLQNDILLLGFIDRAEQLCLMANSYAVVQPSLFEGWSTTVEDVKSIGKFIFLSDLPVHREQNPPNVCYFNPNSPIDLTNKLLSVRPTSLPYDYEADIQRSAFSFFKIIDNF